MFFLKQQVARCSFAILLFSCSKSTGTGESNSFQNVVSTVLASDFPGEVSGMADSYARPGFLWLIQDEDNQPELLCMSHEGQLGTPVKVLGAANQDWEDLAIGKGPVAGIKYLYIADSGDNDSVFDTYFIYRFPEPNASVSEVDQYDKIRFRYDDGLHHNTEAMVIDHKSGDIVLVTKENPAQVFVLKAASLGNGVNTAERKGQLKFGGITGAAQTPDGTELLLRTYSNLYYWKKSADEPVYPVLQKDPVNIGIQTEPQGEAIAFRNDQKGFFTLSENAGLPILLKLHYYSRN